MSDQSEKFIYVKLAGKVVRIGHRLGWMRTLCRDYMVEPCTGSDDRDADMNFDFEVGVSADDIETERKRNEEAARLRNEEVEGILSDGYVEAISAYRKISDRMPEYGIIMMHGAVVAVDGKAYIFLAKSGVGKTTHVLNWIKAVPGAVIINGDKPLIDTQSKMVWGTPWCGKEGFNTNIGVKLAGICLLERAEKNRIEPVSFSDAIGVILQQTHRGDDKDTIAKALKCVEKLKDVPCYRLECNMDAESAVVAYEGMNYEA